MQGGSDQGRARRAAAAEGGWAPAPRAHQTAGMAPGAASDEAPAIPIAPPPSTRDSGAARASSRRPFRPAPKPTRAAVCPDGQKVPAQLRRLWAAWVDGFAARHGGATPQASPRALAQLRALRDAHGEAEVLDLMGRFLASGTGWVRKRGAWSVGAFAASWDELVTARARREV